MMNKTNFTTKLNRSFKMAGLRVKKHSPEILLVAGIAGVVTSAVLACRASLKVNSVLEQSKSDIEEIHDSVEKGFTKGGAEYSADDSKKDLAIVYTQTGIKLVKLYAPAVGIGVLSIASILASNNILKKRTAALAAAYGMLDSTFKDYRNRVIDRFGEDLDRELRYNIKAVEVEEKTVDEKGKEKVVKKTINVVNLNEPSIYARFFDDGCNGWDKDSEYNLMFLKHQQNYANELLQSNGFVFLNDVYDMLGIPRTKAGQQVGWVLDNPQGDGHIDFGIWDVNKPKNMDFVNGYERSILLDFNVDGYILDLI